MVRGSDGGRDMGASGWGGRWGVAKIACGVAPLLAWEESGQQFGSLAWENEVQALSGLGYLYLTLPNALPHRK